MQSRRGRSGEMHPRATLTSRDVEAIRRLRENGIDYKLLSEVYGTSIRNIGAICRFERWCERVDI
jgi:hypothetical protein